MKSKLVDIDDKICIYNGTSLVQESAELYDPSPLHPQIYLVRNVKVALY